MKRAGYAARALYLGRELADAVLLLVTSPRAGRQRIRRAVGVLRAGLLFRGCTCGELVNAAGPVRVVAGGTIRIGDRSQFAAGMMSTELICHEGGELIIGAHAFFNYGVSVEASQKVQIGERCLLGSMVRICDVGPTGTAPVIIGDDVWIAHGAIIEPGSTIGRGSVVAAGAVVRDAVPDHCLASGNPAVSVPLRGEQGRRAPAMSCSAAASTKPVVDSSLSAIHPHQGIAR